MTDQFPPDNFHLEQLPPGKLVPRIILLAEYFLTLNKLYKTVWICEFVFYENWFATIFIINKWNLYYSSWKYSGIDPFVFINSFPCSCALSSQWIRISSSIFQLFCPISFGNIHFFFLPQNILKSICVTVRFSWMRIFGRARF